MGWMLLDFVGSWDPAEADWLGGGVYGWRARRAGRGGGWPLISPLTLLGVHHCPPLLPPHIIPSVLLPASVHCSRFPVLTIGQSSALADLVTPCGPAYSSPPPAWSTQALTRHWDSALATGRSLLTFLSSSSYPANQRTQDPLSQSDAQTLMSGTNPECEQQTIQINF